MVSLLIVRCPPSLLSRAVSPDNRFVILGHEDATVHVFSPVKDSETSLSLDPLLLLHGHSHRITAITCSPLLGIVLSAAADGSLLLHSLLDGSLVRHMREEGHIQQVAVSSYGHLASLCAHAHGNQIRCRSLSSHPLHEEQWSGSHIHFSACGRFLVVVSSDCKGLHAFSPPTPEDSWHVEVKEGISCLAVIRGHLVLGLDNGELLLVSVRESH